MSRDASASPQKNSLRDVTTLHTPAAFYHSCTEDFHRFELDLAANEPLFPIDELFIFDLYMVGELGIL